jgi:hypothetical protein
VRDEHGVFREGDRDDESRVAYLRVVVAQKRMDSGEEPRTEALASMSRCGAGSRAVASGDDGVESAVGACGKGVEAGRVLYT